MGLYFGNVVVVNRRMCEFVLAALRAVRCS